MNAKETEFRKVMERFRGFLEGIVSDQKVNSAELASIREWAQAHEYVSQHWPVRDAIGLIDDVLSDDKLDPDDAFEFVQWSDLTLRQLKIAPQESATAIAELHGFLSGIAADRRVSSAELNKLSGWMMSHRDKADLFPFRESIAIIQEILADGIVSPDEQAKFLEFADQFVERRTQDQSREEMPRFMENDAPIIEPISGLFDPSGIETLAGKTFCLTGQAANGTRGEMELLVMQAGGLIANVTRKLDYLVIGAKSSPAWRYATYGRKIEKVMTNRTKGATTKIVSEEQLMAAL